MIRQSVGWTAWVALMAAGLCAQTVRVSDSDQLRRALAGAGPGTTILLEPGRYRGDVHVSDLAGGVDAPITIAGADPEDPPVFDGGRQALHLADCRYIVLRNLFVQGCSANGINIDDGGTFATPAHHVVVEGVTIRRIGPRGNYDGLKISGVDYFTVRRCRFEGWGGSAIDMVGCHHGTVEDCTFVGLPGFSQSNAIQLKGGTRDMLVQACLFRSAGRRAINLGGSTGPAYFRPCVEDFEAKDIEIAGNRFVGGVAALGWVTADGGHVHHNTIILPEKWVLRILQETTDPRFKPCHSGVFEDNLIVFDERVRVFVNVGPRTAPKTFVFRRNAWCDRHGRRRPVLPVPETDGLYGCSIVADEGRLATGRVRLTRPTDRPIGAAEYTPLKRDRWPRSGDRSATQP